MSTATPPPELRARVVSYAKSSPSPPRAAVQRANAATLAVGFAALVAIFVALGGADLTTRPPAFLALTLVGWISIALLATWGGFGRGRSMLGRGANVLVTVALVTGPGLLAWMLLGTSMYPGTLGFPASLKVHVTCFVSTTIMAIGPFAALAFVRRGYDPRHPRASGAALGAAAGAWAGVMIELHCPVSDAMHVAMAHVLPVVLFAALGALVGRRLLGVRQ
jgi:hypothetical protein